MSVDWSKTVNLENEQIVFRKKNSPDAPRVTVGLPTFKRPETLRRTLASIASQSFRNFVLIVSDNANDRAGTIAAVEQYAAQLPEVIVVMQPQNIGALPNLAFLLAAARTEYFVWVADDDEISPAYLHELVALLDKNPAAVTAMGQWMSMKTPREGSVRPQLRPTERSRFLRIAKFVAGEADDSPFYGLHRTRYLRTISFPGYFPPNRGVLTNCCYLFLFDLLLAGPFVYSDKAAWICHNYVAKEYNRALARGVGDRLKTLLRRLNVYTIYVGKAVRKAPLLAPMVFAASLVGFTRDIVTATWRTTSRAVTQRELAR